MADRLNQVQEVLTAIERAQNTVRIRGGGRSSYAWLLSKIFASDSRSCPFVLICPTEDDADLMTQDLATFLSTSKDPAAVEVLRLPAYEQSPFNSIRPSIRIRHQRIAALARAHILQKVSARFIMVTTPLGVAQATLSPETLKQKTFVLTPNDELPTGSRGGFARLLEELGYLKVETVEDPGTFCFRGELLDIFVPDQHGPLRIELFDTLIEKIRPFDAKSQTSTKTHAAVNSLTIWPAREFLFSLDQVSSIRDAIKTYCDDNGVPRSIRDPALHGLGLGLVDFGFPEGCDFWTPFLPRFSSDALSHLHGPTVLWFDAFSAKQTYKKTLDGFLAQEGSPQDRKTVVPSISSLFLSPEELNKRTELLHSVFFDLVQIEEASTKSLSNSFVFFVEPNSDLRSRSLNKNDPLGSIKDLFTLWRREGVRVTIFSHTQSQLERIRFLLTENHFTVDGEFLCLEEGVLSEGFRWLSEGLVFLDESDFFGQKRAIRPQKRAATAGEEWAGLQSLSDLNAGDLVVHREHGIGRYQGLVRLELSGAPSDFLLLEYANKDKLYLPVYRLNVVQRYGTFNETSALDRLGSPAFLKTKEKVREAVKSLAIDLVKLYAERAIRPAVRFGPRDSLFSEFEAKFQFEETPDQSKAIQAVLKDLESGQVMDRLVCGDVGYGKTEVAIRAAFKAVSEGKQVAVLVPTTLLAFQHEQSFSTRLKDYPISIASVSRFKTPKEQKEVLLRLREGKVDIVIGTHRLLSNDVEFSELGLVIVDEEHRFGVEHKERLKTLKINTHVLTLTATPIPRTLHMALSGLRDISLINTPPVDRLPIRTYVSRYDEDLIRRAIETELGRGGQVFVLHNKVQTIFDFKKTLSDLVPRARFAVAHGQMKEAELEKIMLGFYNKEFDVLVCTTIIESGIDVPSANTIVIDRADSLGLAQLYQIRGRVGRGQHRAFAYLLLPEEADITSDAKKRLEVIQRFVDLGSGFMIASHDLEIRGGGDLLGAQQSGHIAALGFDLYTELLEEAIAEIKNADSLEERARETSEPEIKTPFPAFFSEDYIPDIHQRLSIYRRLSSLKNTDGLLPIEEELRDRFGPLPAEAQNMLWMIRIKLLLKSLGFSGLTIGPEKWVLQSSGKGGARVDPAKVVSLVASQPKKYQFAQDSRLVITGKLSSLPDASHELEKILSQVSSS